MCAKSSQSIATRTRLCCPCSQDSNAERVRRLRPGRLAQGPRGLQTLATAAVSAENLCRARPPFGLHSESPRTHTRRIKNAARACALFACPFGHFGRHTAPGGASRLLDRACIAPIHGVCHDRGAIRRPLPPPIHGPTYARTRFKHRPIHDRHTRIATEMRGWRLLTATDTRSRSARPAQSAAFLRSDSWKDRASAMSLSTSSSRPLPTIASRFSVARNQV